MFGWLFERLGIPPMVACMEIGADKIGFDVSIRTSPRYTIIKIDGVELFFNRESGAYDGHGGMRVGGNCTRVVVR